MEQIANMEQTASLDRATAAPRRRGRLRRLLQAAAAAVSVAGATVLVAAQPAQAEPAYYLYEYLANIPGPCGSQLAIGNYVGSVSYNPPYRWDKIYVRSFWFGDEYIQEWEERSFQTGNGYNACHNYRFVIRVYGAAKTHRIIESHWWCPPDLLSCVYHGDTYSSWSGGW
jgi:hypothetical protein